MQRTHQRVQCRFDIPAFYREAARVLRPGGTLAVWGYGLNTFDGEPAATKALQALHDDVLGPYWDAKRQLLMDQYKGAASVTVIDSQPCGSPETMLQLGHPQALANTAIVIFRGGASAKRAGELCAAFPVWYVTQTHLIFPQRVIACAWCRA